MLSFLKSLVRAPATTPATNTVARAAPPALVNATGAQPFDLAASLTDTCGFPVVDWDAAQQWVEALPDESAQADAWSACELAWLEHMREALGPGYSVGSKGSAIVLSTLPGHVADATLAYVERTLRHIMRVLDGVAFTPDWGHDILIVFDDEDAYYRYISHYYPDAGEFAASSGMYINFGCGHFVTVKADLHTIEPIIAHELTHSCLAHLPIPAWLNEGLAVNTEHRLSPPAYKPPNAQMQHARHQKFWGVEEIQEFWSGKSFLRNDEGNELSYDLARILVAQFAKDWERFKQFTLGADAADGAASAAQEHLGIDLGATVCALLELAPNAAYAPQPQTWQGAPERGAFRLAGGARLTP